MQLLKNRLSPSKSVTPDGVNSAIGEIQAVLNKIGVLRGEQVNAQSDYFVFDKGSTSLYLVTIEGERIPVTIG